MVTTRASLPDKPAKSQPKKNADRVPKRGQGRCINLKGTFLCAQTVAKAMIQKGNGGKIINMSSIMGSVALPPRAPYCASKGGIIALTKDLAAEWAKHRITVSTDCPGMDHNRNDSTLRLPGRSPPVSPGSNTSQSPGKTGGCCEPYSFSVRVSEYITGAAIHRAGDTCGWRLDRPITVLWRIISLIKDEEIIKTLLIMASGGAIGENEENRMKN